jgi:hypothetical protein
MFSQPYTLNPHLENEPLVWVFALLVLIILLQKWRGVYLRRDIKEWKAAYYAEKKKYDDLPEVEEEEEDEEDEEEDLPSTDAELIRVASELRGQVIGLTGRLEAANALVTHYKNSPDTYWKGKYEGLAAESTEYRRAIQRELFFLRSIANSEAAEGLKDWMEEDDDR